MINEDIINNWEIYPNVGVENFSILDEYDKVIEFLKSNNINYSIEKNRVFYSLNTGNIRVAFDKNKQIFAISVFNNFRGKIHNLIGLGSTLQDVKEKLGEYTEGFNEIYPTYELKKFKGVEFKLSDEDKYDDINDIFEWNETVVPIVEITVWNEETWAKQTT